MNQLSVRTLIDDMCPKLGTAAKLHFASWIKDTVSSAPSSSNVPSQHRCIVPASGPAVVIHFLTSQRPYFVRLTINMHLQTTRQTALCDTCASDCSYYG